MRVRVKGMVLGAAVPLILVLFAATALTPSTASGQAGASRDFTHTVFGEFGSSTS
jgi:hypothetical protein